MVNIAHKVTKRLKRKVMLAVASDVRQEAIAELLKIDPVTLRKYYWLELHIGKEIIRDELRDALMKAVAKGNVSAMKYLDAKANPDTVPKQYEGKKERQAEAAKVAGIGTEWEADLLRVMPQADDKPN